MKIKLTKRNILTHGSIVIKKDETAEVPMSVAEFVVRSGFGIAVDDEAKKLAEELAAKKK